MEVEVQVLCGLVTALLIEEPSLRGTRAPWDMSAKSSASSGMIQASFVGLRRMPRSVVFYQQTVLLCCDLLSVSTTGALRRTGTALHLSQLAANFNHISSVPSLRLYEYWNTGTWRDLVRAVGSAPLLMPKW